MTIFYPDISGYQAGIRITSPAVVCKATEGTGYENPDYVPAQGRAATAGAFFGAYHFLQQGNAYAQAQHAFNVVGKNVPLMLDWESEPDIKSYPTVSDALNFINYYRSLGGICYVMYLPKWYWQDYLGSADLSAFRSLGMLMVSSDYTTYSDSGPGWVGYGGMDVTIWQYTSTMVYNGFSAIDFNAFKGTVAQLKALFLTGGAVNPYPLLVEGSTDPAVKTLQTRLNVWGAKLTVDGAFGPATLAAVEAFQSAHALSVDGEVGPLTWAILKQNPDVDPLVPDVLGKSAGNAHNSLVGAGLVPTAVVGQLASEITTAVVPAVGKGLVRGTRVSIVAATPPTLQINMAGIGNLASWVKLVQHDLNRASVGLAEDGSFGPDTLAAVQSFQGKHGLAQDGIVGPESWAALGAL